MSNPLAQLRAECRQLLEAAVKGLYPDVEVPEGRFSSPPDPAMGELSSSIAFQLAAQGGMKPEELAEAVARGINVEVSETRGVSSPAEARAPRLIASAEAVNGYINFRAEVGGFSRLVLEAAGEEDYGFLRTSAPLRVMVEHTSANPVRPLHIGTARNAILGDALAEMLRRRGHRVETHFYVDDMGRQVAMAAYGWRLLGRPEPEGRPDAWFGEVYAAVNILTEVLRLRAELGLAEADGDDERVAQVNQELGKYAAAAQELRGRNAALFDALAERFAADPDPEAGIMRLNTAYERGDPGARGDVRRLVEFCVRGFEEALGGLGIRFDAWDYEGDLVWSGAVEEAMAALKATPYTSYEAGALVLDCEAVARDLGLKARWGINPGYEVPRLVLVRADGTSLYTPRDVAYSLWKFGRVDRVVNVIGYEQSLAQLQLRIALAAMGSVDLADGQTHFAYEFVRLPDVKMSGRLGRYVTLAEAVDRSVALAYDEVTKRSGQLPEERRRDIARMVGVGALKYTLLSVDPMKVVVFDWARALNFETNSAPFIQYSHARACNILKRAEGRPEPDYGLLADRRERDLVTMVAQFPDVFEAAAEELRPTAVAAHANALADRFNSFYAALPVLRADPPGLAGARLRLVDAVRVVLRNALTLLRIEAPDLM